MNQTTIVLDNNGIFAAQFVSLRDAEEYQTLRNVMAQYGIPTIIDLIEEIRRGVIAPR